MDKRLDGQTDQWMDTALTALPVLGFGALGHGHDVMVGEHPGPVCQLPAGAAQRLAAGVAVEHQSRILHTDTKPPEKPEKRQDSWQRGQFSAFVFDNTLLLLTHDLFLGFTKALFIMCWFLEKRGKFFLLPFYYFPDHSWHIALSLQRLCCCPPETSSDGPRLVEHCCP